MILLTGASGFIGKHLLIKLTEQFGKNNIIALTSKPISNFNYILDENYSLDTLKASLKNINTIIHSGAYIPKKGSDANNWLGCNSNIINTHKLLLAILESNVNNLIFLSTSDVYAKNKVLTEEAPLSPQTLYGQSKVYCEKMIEAWGQEKQKIFQILRIGHVYGPGEETYQKIIPVTMKRIAQGLSPQIWGSGEEIRSFIYIKDLVDAIVKSLDFTKFLGPINIAGQHSISINNLVRLIQNISNDTSTIEYMPTNISVNNIHFDNHKMKTLLTSEKVSLEEGLELEWLSIKASKNHENIF